MLPSARAVCAAARSPSTQSASSARSAFCFAPTAPEAIFFACRLWACRWKLTPPQTSRQRFQSTETRMDRNVGWLALITCEYICLDHRLWWVSRERRRLTRTAPGAHRRVASEVGLDLQGTAGALTLAGPLCCGALLVDLDITLAVSHQVSLSGALPAQEGRE